jgi:hypothetical protein
LLTIILEKIEMVFPVLSTQTKQANMNYEQALKFKVIWEKNSRPKIKDFYLPHSAELLKLNTGKMVFGELQLAHLGAMKEGKEDMVKGGLTKDELFNCMMGSDAFADIPQYYCRTQFQCDNRSELLHKCVFQDDFIDIQMGDIQENLAGIALATKQLKKEACIWAYIYNVDVEQAELRIEQWKELSCEAQEWWETNHEKRAVCLHSHNSPHSMKDTPADEIHRNENAYIQFCNREKQTYETFQRTLVILKKYRDVVRPILRAGRHMNKRKNGKKNRG